MGELFTAAAPLSESEFAEIEAECAVSAATRQKMLTQWSVSFFPHERCRPQCPRTMLSHEERCRQTSDDVLKEGEGCVFSELTILELTELETFIFDSISGNIVEHRRPLPLWFRRIRRISTEVNGSLAKIEVSVKRAA